MTPHFSPRNVLMFGMESLWVVDCRYFTVMLGLAAAASCMPCHANWLNDLSLMPPVSVTMQPRSLAPGAAAVLDALVLTEVDALAAGVLLGLLTLDVLLPHATSSRVAAPAAAAEINAVCLTISSTEPVAVAQP